MRGMNRSLIVAAAARTLASLLASGKDISRHMRRNFAHVFGEEGGEQVNANRRVRGRGRQGGAYDPKSLRWFGMKPKDPALLTGKGPRPWWTYRPVRRNAAREAGLLGV